MHRKTNLFALALLLLAGLVLATPVGALEDGTLRVNPRNGWMAFEIITVGDNPAGDGFNWSMPGSFDGIGAQADGTILRLQINHELTDATISELELNLANLEVAVANKINSGSTGGVSFVLSARQAYDRWSADGGANWTNTNDASNTTFGRFCSGQSYLPDTFGMGRGFRDEIYITGEEVDDSAFFAIDLANRDLYQLSGVSGSASGGIGGMPFDKWENAALIDTGESNHVALLLSPDGGTQTMTLYVGEKGKDASGNASNGFLARNGLHYGSWYYLNDNLPNSGTSTNGFFDTTSGGALSSSKLEDVDTSPEDPTQVVLGDQTSGLFTFEFELDFSGGSFNAGASSFSITKIQDHNDDTDDSFGDADNVDWTAATTLGGVEYVNGLIFVNEDTGTDNGEIWMMRPDGGGLVKIADTTGVNGATESSGILDISTLLGYHPGSVLLTSNQGSNSSLSLLIHPNATLMPVPVVAQASKLLDGLAGGGQLSDADESDDVYFELDPFPTNNPIKQKVDIVLLSESPVSDPSSFALRVEAAMLGGPEGDVIQRIELWDEANNVWDTVDSRSASIIDSVVEVSATGDLSRYVHPLNGEILARVVWSSPEFSAASFDWTIDLDQAVWFIE